jgi:hypothetical protein
MAIKRFLSFCAAMLSLVSTLAMLYIAAVASIFEFHYHRILLILWLLLVLPGFAIPLFTTLRWIYLGLFVVTLICGNLSYVLGRKKTAKQKLRLSLLTELPQSEKCPNCGSVLENYGERAWLCLGGDYIASLWTVKPVIVDAGGGRLSIVETVPFEDLSCDTNRPQRLWKAEKGAGGEYDLSPI